MYKSIYENKEERPLIVAIDFDGTIVDNGFPEVGTPMPYAADMIRKLHADGCYIIIWTCRYTPEHIGEMVEYLNDSNIPYHKINENADFLDFKPYPKIFYNILIDDRMLGGLKDWREMYKMIRSSI